MSAALLLEQSPQALSASEFARLADCESKIERGIAVFLEVGNALLEIRDSRLYRQQFSTFEDYCKERWGFARNYANKVIAATEVVANLGTNVPIAPVTESQARPLAALEPEVQREVWREVTETTPPDKITAKVIERASKAAGPLNETVKAIKAEIDAPNEALFPASPAIAEAAQQSKNGAVSLLEAARKVRQAIESEPIPPAAPLHDLEGIDPALYPRATELQGMLNDLAAFSRKHDPKALAGAFKAHEIKPLKSAIAEVEAWIDRFVVNL